MRLNVRFRNLVCPSDKATPVQPKKYDFCFDEDQTWVDLNRPIEFVPEDGLDEGSPTPEKSDHNIAVDGAVEENINVDAQEVGFYSTAQEGNSEPAALEEQAPTSDSPSDGDTTPFQTSIPGEDPPEYTAVSEHTPYDPPEHTLLGSVISWPKTAVAEDSAGTRNIPDGNDVSFLGSLSRSGNVEITSQVKWPLQSLHEAKLLRHFVTYLSPWVRIETSLLWNRLTQSKFDVGDSKRHFAKIVPCMAASSPVLMTAVFALAALHFSRTSGNDNLYNAMTYHDKCLGMIVPILSDPDRFNDDGILMTTTILHLYDGLESGNDLPRHLKGTSIFYPAEATCNSSHLRRAVFWLHLRQEIYNAYLYQRSVATDLSNCKFESEKEPWDDDTWFHQTLYITAQVTKWAFGEEASHAGWYELCHMVDAWENARPASFDPIHFRPRDAENGRYFPEICYATDEHVAAAHFICMAKLLLTTHDPTIPRIGLRMRSATKAMQNTAQSYVRALVGIAECNGLVIARFTANLAVNICAGWFTDPQEQEALLDFMRETSKCSGWCGHNAQQALLKEWGLSS
ncbi:hypothetical protein ACLMJK_009115 [Lecanora helva]